jgi:histidinol-phosphatase
MNLDDDLQLAFELAAAASEIATGYFERGFETFTKPDGSPVTEADLAVDRYLVEQLGVLRPGDSILSEESGPTEPTDTRRSGSARRWILDPIDGTFNFERRHPHWGTHVALEIDGEVALGVITRPRLDARWWAVRGHGAWHVPTNAGGAPVRLHVSATADLDDARIRVWASRLDARHVALGERVVLGAPDLNDILDLAAGRIDAIVSARGAVWDNAPQAILIEEAGGRYRDAAGGRRLDHGEAHFSNGVIDAALDPFLS